MSRYLTIYEVSQKQKFIFSSNKLKENIRNSDVIAFLTSADFISQCVGEESLFSEKNNMVYAGTHRSPSLTAHSTVTVMDTLPSIFTLFPASFGSAPGRINASFLSTVPIILPLALIRSIMNFSFVTPFERLSKSVIGFSS